MPNVIHPPTSLPSHCPYIPPYVHPYIPPPQKKIINLKKKFSVGIGDFICIHRESVSPDILNILFLTQAFFLSILVYPKMCINLVTKKKRT